MFKGGMFVLLVVMVIAAALILVSFGVDISFLEPVFKSLQVGF